MSSPSYTVLLHGDSLSRLTEFKESLANGKTQPGGNLKQAMGETSIQNLSTEQFLDLLLRTKEPCIFAESGVALNGKDWTKEEFSILGDVSIAVEVTVFDNGAWNRHEENFRVHEPPFSAHLLFVPGPLLSTPRSPDYDETVVGGRLDYEKYAVLLKRRLIPLFHFAHSQSTSEEKAIITIPGIGCGAFGGKFGKEVSNFLQRAIGEILTQYKEKLQNIRCVVYVPYSGETSTEQVGSISYRIRPYMTHSLPQLSKPISFQESGDDFSKLRLFKFVAWDHVSYPGNDFFRGSRYTDDGVAAAATDCMAKILGVEGTRTRETDYEPPQGFDTWEDVVYKKKISLFVRNNLRVFLDTNE